MPRNLLVIEDSPAIAKVIEKLGNSLNYHVTIAHSFAEVKNILAENTDFFAATIDYGLPDAPHGEAIHYVLERDIPSIVMTGRVDDETHNKIINLPVIDYVTKENTQAYHYLLRLLHSQMTNANIGVMVVDESLASRNYLGQLLERRNFKVFKVADGNKALELLAEFPDIKIVITNQEMPVMDGLTLVQNIRKIYDKNRHIIMAVSDSKKKFQSARFIKNGADDFLRKPFCPEEFYCRMMQHIEKLQYIEQIEGAANKDYLTQLFNRRYFLEQASFLQKILQQKKQNGVIAIIYVDKFKNINEKHSNDIGDKTLLAVANLLKQYFPDDLIARLGGAEFGLLINSENLTEVEQNFVKLKKACQQTPVKTEQHSSSYTISIGGTLIEAEQSLKAALKLADIELHKAQQSGGNNIKLNGFITA